MNQFRRFMYGRYGFDPLTRDMVILSMLITLTASLTRWMPLYALSYLLLLYALFRTFSRNIQKRSKENMVYYKITGSFRKRLHDDILILIGTKTHKFYRCSKCKQTIRVPRGKGKICITCPKCRNEFVRKT
jgi:hypothetical protein